MQRRLQGQCRAFLALVALLPAPCWGRVPSPQGPEILHHPIECWPQDEFLLLRATFRPASDIQTAKVYFRSDKYPDFYYVVLNRDSRGQASAVMPKPGPDTTGVIYYLEGVSLGFTAGRSAEWNARVADPNECKRRDPEMMLFNGEQPNITVGATQAGLPQVPPGFQAVGITKFINAAGVVGHVGGGGLGVKIGLAAGGAAAAIFALTSGGDGSSTSTTPGAVISSSTTSSVPVGNTTSTSTTTIGGGGSTTTIVGGSTTTVVGGSTTTVIGGSTTTVVGSSTTTIVGSSTTTSAGSSTTTSVGSSTTTSAGSSTTTSPSTSSSTTTSVGSSTTTSAGSSTTTSAGSTSTVSTTSVSTTSSSTTTTVAATADVAVSKTDSPDPVRLSLGNQLTYTVTVRNFGPATAPSVTFDDNLPSGVGVLGFTGSCVLLAGPRVRCGVGSLPNGGTASVDITVAVSGPGTLSNSVNVFSGVPDPDTSNNSDTETTTVQTALTEPPETEVGLTFTSALVVEPRHPTARGHVVVNGSLLETTDSQAPRDHRVPAQPGPNRIEAYAESSADEGFWRFDFAGSPHFVAGSLRVESGEVISLDATSVVFALPRASERIRFTLDLHP